MYGEWNFRCALIWEFNIECGLCLALIAFPGVQSYESRFWIPAYMAIDLLYKRMHQEWRVQRRIENVHEHDHHPNRWHRGWQCARKFDFYILLAFNYRWYRGFLYTNRSMIIQSLFKQSFIQNIIDAVLKLRSILSYTYVYKY